MIGDDFSEKRIATRFEVNIPVNYFTADNSDPAYYGFTRDISTHGLGLVTEQKAPEGAFLDICLKIPNDEYIKVRGRVVWTTATVNGKYRIGIGIEGEKLKPVPILLKVVRYQKGI